MSDSNVSGSPASETPASDLAASDPGTLGPVISNRAAQGLVFFTSAAVLVLEILAGRLMAPFVGVSLETFTGIIGTILAGIAVGSAVGGRMADQRDPAGLLGPILVAGGALSALSLPIVSQLGPSMGSDPISIVVLAAFSFFLPAAVLSSVSPMVAKLRLGDLGDTGTVIGSLSAAGTFGALAGTFITGFVLVSAAPTRPIVLGVSVALVVAGLLVGSRLSNGRPNPAALAGAAAFLLMGATAQAPCDVESAYACIRVEVDPGRPSGRSLYLNGLRNSYVDLEDPTYLEFRYFRMFADVVDVMPAGPINALHIGGAGFTFPRYVETTRPGSDNLVLEIDAEALRVAEEQLGLVLGPDLRVTVGDARLALTDLANDQFDLIIGDAFAGKSVPWHLTTAEVMLELDRAMTPSGVLIMNVIDGGTNDFARAELATMREHFNHLAIIVPPGGANRDFVQNQVLIASDKPLPPIVVDSADGTLLVDAEVTDYIGDARVLTDDFAPADQLTRDF